MEESTSASTSLVQSTIDKGNVQTTNGKLRGDLILAKSIINAMQRKKEKVLATESSSC